jgi:pimeloyl-ACP methyl ester carboxylesterase
MSDPSEKIKCPDCQLIVLRKNLQKHYRRSHPGLDPFIRLRQSREERIRRSGLDVKESWIAGAFITVIVVILIVIGALVVVSLINKEGRAIPDEKPVFFAASDGVVINGTWYGSAYEGRQTIYLVHDIGRDRTVWKDYASELQGKGYNVLAIDLRGHGESTKSISDPNKVYDWRTMGHTDFLGISRDVTAAYQWVHGTGLDGEPNTDAGEDGSFIGVGRGGLYALNQYARMSRERIMSSVVVSPTLDCYGLDVEQVFQDFGDTRPIMLAASDGDGTGELAIDTILTTKELDGEKNGVGYFVIGSSQVGMPLFEYKSLKEQIIEVLEDGWNVKLS